MWHNNVATLTFPESPSISNCNCNDYILDVANCNITGGHHNNYSDRGKIYSSVSPPKSYKYSVYHFPKAISIHHPKWLLSHTSQELKNVMMD